MYPWVLAFHIIFVVSWFAGIFYLPRLFVYHAMTEDETGIERFKIMERKLFRGIMTPSAVLAVMLGAALYLYRPSYYLAQGWMHAKLFCVLLLIGHHVMCWHFLKLFREDRNTYSHVFYRWFNEVPVVLLIAIVIFVIVEPF